MRRSIPLLAVGLLALSCWTHRAEAGRPEHPSAVRSRAGSGAAVGLAAPASATTWSCALCHSEASWDSIPRHVDFDHDRTGVPLTGAHKRAPCVGCHQPHRRRGRVPRACNACHHGPHRGEQGRRCDDCHTSSTWRTPRRFPNHAMGRFPLSGAHALLDCRSCHRGRARDQYRGTPTTCDACHRRRAMSVTAFAHAGTSLGCNRCHNTFSWAPARFDHGVFWPLRGGHATVANDCKRCHPTGTYRAASRACVGCHADKLSTAKTHPEHVAIGLTHTCERCHTPIAWNALAAGWHEPAFPTNSGKHARYRADCGSCHPGGVGKGHFDCIHCHDGRHGKARMDAKHLGEVGGYQWANGACLSCHPRGSQ